MRTLYISIVFLSALSACSKRSSFSSDERSGVGVAEQAAIESFVNASVEVDEAGNVKSVAGFEASSKISSVDERKNLQADEEKSTVEVQEDIKDMISNNENLFTYTEPEGLHAEFSEPIMVSASYLALARTSVAESMSEQCSGLPYQDIEPTLAEIIGKADTCGSFFVNFCIRVSRVKRSSSSVPVYAYIKSPDLSVSLPCAKESFQGIQFHIANGSGSTSEDKSDLQITAGPLVSEMYITNQSDCNSGGVWQSVTTQKSAWPLLWDGDKTEAKVYAKFKDLIFGSTSDCIFDSINYQASASEDIFASDTTPPSATSVDIAGGAEYTTSARVTLTLAATDVSDMYITNTANCTEGGVWQPFATSKEWILGQSNAEAKVYVKYRDAAGNGSACISDAIIHDNTVPSATSISIASAAAYTTTSSVALTLAATGAAEMYVTNTSGCGSGGAYEAYSTSKSGWTLGQTNATATVYVKYKDSAGNESACINDTIVHDSTAPTSTSISISSGAAYTTSSSVTLTLAATGAAQMYLTNTAGCASGSVYVTYATTKLSYALVQSNSTATVYAKFKDAAGNESACINDTIVHDGIDPTAPGSFDDSSSSTLAAVSFTWSASSDGGSGISAYEVAIGTTAGDDDVYAFTSVGNVTSATISGLSLTASTTYYGAIRAVDAAGRASSVSEGNGFVANSALSSLSSSKIENGAEFACTIVSGGNVKCWGDNGFGQLGKGNTTDVTDAASSVAVGLGTGRTAKMLALGNEFACAILDNNTVKCWGNNDEGQLGQNNTTIYGDSSGEVAALSAVNLGTGRTAVQISAGMKHVCALLDDATMKCWGLNDFGQLGQDLATSASLGDAAGEMAAISAINLGTGRTAAQIAAGHDHTCALLDDGAVKCWGKNSSGELGMGNTAQIGDGAGEMAAQGTVNLGSGRTATQIAAGHGHTCVILDNSALKCWGDSAYGQLGQNTTVDVGTSSSTEVANLTAVNLGAGNTASKIVLGNHHSCALLAGTDVGKAKCWGKNTSGQLGQGSTSNLGDGGTEMSSLAVINLGTGRTVSHLSAGHDFSCAILDNASVKCWGKNGAMGKLGIGAGSTDNRGDAGGEMGDSLPALGL